MPDPDHSQSAAPLSRGRIPTGALASTLRSQVDAVMRVLASARQDADFRPSVPPLRLVETYRDDLQAAMYALGETLADFLVESVLPVDFETLRTGILEPILTLVRTLPLHRRVEESTQHTADSFELQRLVLDGRPMGFDLESLLLEDFLQNGPGARSFRRRAAAMVSLFHAEAAHHRGPEVRELRVLVLGADTVLSLDAPFQNHISTASFSFLVVDGDTRALRWARRRIEEILDVRPAVVRSTPESFAKNPGRDIRPFDIVFTLTTYNTLSPEAALGFTRGVADLLKAGGALLTGCYLPGVPRAMQALALAFASMEWHYWDEGMWREMLSQLPFDLSASRFDTLPPHTLVVLARRSQQEMFR
jgi:hypothetical protein